MGLIDNFARYLSNERNYSSRTVDSYTSDLVQFDQYIKGIDATQTLETADRDMVRDWMVSLMDTGSGPASVNRKLSTLRTFYRYLRLTGVVESSPAALVKGPKKPKPLPYFVRESEMDSILDSHDFGQGYKAVRDRAIMAVFYEAGLRLAELVSLDVRDIDMQAHLIKVTGKRNKQRIIPFGPDLESIITEYLTAREEFAGTPDGPFFLGTKGGRIPRHQVYQMVHQVLSQESDVGKKSPHVLRHSFATSMLNHDAGLETVRELLGHDSVSTTEIYTHTTFKELQDVYKKAHPRADKG